METLTVHSILNKTNHGIDIYAHILKKCYPENCVAFYLSGRDCGICRNPFNEGKRTLHIYIEKTDVSNPMSAEFAFHEDIDGATIPGNAIDFAALYYNKNGTELLDTLNDELHLHIGEERCFYSKDKIEAATDEDHIAPERNQPRFSFFMSPVRNTKPYKDISIFDAFSYVRGLFAKERTEKLRSIADANERRKFKADRFDYCTFSGTFTNRNDKNIVKHSGLICIDFDHIEDVEGLFKKLLLDEYFDTELLFRSPSGDGLKWVVPITVTAKEDHLKYFSAIENYIKSTYGVEIDKSGKDMSRACFLPYDPNAYINPKYVLHHGKEKIQS